MHELSLAASLIEQCEEVAKKSNGKLVRSITVGVGELSGVEPEALEFCFAIVAEGSIAEKANLIIQRLPVKLSCRNCGLNSEVNVPIMLCGGCGGSDVEVISGMDFLLLEVEIE